MTVGQHVNAENQAKKVHMPPRIMTTIKLTAMLTNVGPTTTEQNPKCQNKNHVADQETLPIKENDCHALPYPRTRA